jgi:hypothetical protein
MCITGVGIGIGIGILKNATLPHASKRDQIRKKSKKPLSNQSMSPMHMRRWKKVRE